MSNLTIANLFGDTSGLEKATGLNSTTLNSITIAVLFLLCACDVLICCFGSLFCICMCYRNRSKNNDSYQLNRVQRTSHIYPKISRLSKVSSSTAGGMEMEWVGTQKTSQDSNVPLHYPTAKVSMSDQSYANMYPHLNNQERQPRESTVSGYMVMESARHPSTNANYEDISNVRADFYDDVMSGVPSLFPDRGTYDDISNVRESIQYEDVLNVRIDPSRDKLI